MLGRNMVKSRLPPIPAWAEEGAATAEFAMVLPSVIAIAGLVLALGRVVCVSMECHNAAAAAAREVTITGNDADAGTAAAHVAGAGVAVSAEHDADTVRVTVTCPVLPGPMNVTPINVTGEATAMRQ